MFSTLTALLLGLLQGLRHAFEPDHLAAVSTFAAERRSPRAGITLGLAWGLGHALTLLVAGGALLALRTRMPAHVEDACELVVAAMLVLLGARCIARALREGGKGAEMHHHHGAGSHVHPTSAPHVHVSRFALAKRPLLVGLVHGLAGSGALAALAVTRIASVPTGLAFIAVFAAGATLGMALLTGALGWPLARVARGKKGLTVLLTSAGIASTLVGVLVAARVVGVMG
jgi:high-affinity nickel-transport protein